MAKFLLFHYKCKHCLKLLSSIKLQVIVLLFFSLPLTSSAKEKLLVLKPYSQSSEIVSAEEIQMNIMNILAVHHHENYDMVYDEQAVKDKESAVKLGLKHKASAVVYGYYEVAINLLIIHLKIVKVRDEIIIDERKRTVPLSSGYMPYLNKFFEETDFSSQFNYANIGVKSGYVINFGFIKNTYSATTDNHPFYYGIFYRLESSETWFKELELGFLTYHTTDSTKVSPNASAYAVPITLSLGANLDITDDFSFSPKLGLGGIFVYTVRTGYTGLGSGIIGKPSLEFNYELLEEFVFHIEGSLIVSIPYENFGKLDYFIIPSIGVSYRY